MDVSNLSSGVTAISSGDTHTCALTVSGGGKCWGANQFGELGTGGRNYLLPSDVLTQPPELLITIERLSTLHGIVPEIRSYRITVANLGAGSATGVLLSIRAPVGLTNVLWDCQVPGDCAPTAGSGAVSVSFDLSAGKAVEVELSGEVLPDVAFIDINAQASVAAGASIAGSLSDPANGIGIFKHGFEP